MSKEPCRGCAFTPGSEANQEPNNYLKGLLCTWGPHAFWCHETIDWRADRTNTERVAEVKSGQAQICRGWQREVQRLQAAGFYRTNRLLRKGVVMNAMEALMILTGNNYDAAAKKEAKADLWRYIQMLCKLEERRRTQPLKSGDKRFKVREQ